VIISAQAGTHLSWWLSSIKSKLLHHPHTMFAWSLKKYTHVRYIM